MQYSEKVLDHFTHPRNVGEIEDANGVGEVGNAKCGDIMKIYLKVSDDGIIEDVKFKTFGCGAAIATSSMATEMVKGKSLEEALKLTNKAVAEALDGLPPVKCVCLQSGLPHGFCGGDFPGTPASNHSLEVVRQGPRLAAGVFTLLLGDSNSLALTLQDVLTFEFCDCREHGQHKLAGRCGCVDCLLATDKFYLFLGQPFHKVKQVARVPRKAADRLYDYRIAAPDIFHHASQFRPVA